MQPVWVLSLHFLSACWIPTRHPLAESWAGQKCPFSLQWTFACSQLISAVGPSCKGSAFALSLLCCTVGLSHWLDICTIHRFLRLNASLQNVIELVICAIPCNRRKGPYPIFSHCLIVTGETCNFGILTNILNIAPLITLFCIVDCKWNNNNNFKSSLLYKLIKTVNNTSQI